MVTNNKANISSSKQEVDNSSNKVFSVLRGVKVSKNKHLKERLQTLIADRGLSEPEFFHSIGMSRQHWYYISWGIWDCKYSLKLKIAKALETDTSVIFLGDESTDVFPNISKEDGRKENCGSNGVIAEKETAHGFNEVSRIREALHTRGSVGSNTEAPEEARETTGSSQSINKKEIFLK